MNFRLFFQHFKVLKNWKWPIFTIFILEIILSLIEIIIPLFSKILFDYVYPFKDLTLLNIVIITSCLFIIIEFYFDCLSHYLETYVSQGYIKRKKENLFDKIQHLDMKKIMSKTHGDLVTRLTDDIEKIENLIFRLPKDLIVNILKLGAIIVLVYTIKPQITLLLLLSIPFYIMEASFFSRRLAKIEEENIDANSKLYDFVQDRLRNITLIKSYCQEEKEIKKFSRQVKTLFIISIKEKIIGTFSVFMNSATVRIWTILLGWYLGYSIIGGTMTVGEAVAITLLSSQIEFPIEELAHAHAEWQTGIVSLKRIEEIERMRPENPIKTSTPPPQIKVKVTPLIIMQL